MNRPSAGNAQAYALPESPFRFDNVSTDDVDFLMALTTLALTNLLQFPEDIGTNEVVKYPGYHAIVSIQRAEPLPRVVVYCNKFEPEGILWTPPHVVEICLRKARILNGVVDP